MPDLTRFSDLKDSQPLTLNGNNDLFAIAVKNDSSETGYTSMTVKPNMIAGYVAEDATYVNLKTGASDNTVVKAINKTLENFADEFNTTAGSTYAKDDCVIYDGVLYQCSNPAGTTSGTFVTADWTQVRAVDVGTGGGGGGSADHITLTQAQYDALVQAGTVDPNAYYFIEDGSPSAYTEKVLYTNLDESSWVSQADGTVITLSDDITQFDEIRFEGAFFEVNNATGHKLTHFSSVRTPKTTIVNCLDNYADSNTNPLQWQAIVDAPCTFLWSNNQLYSYGFSLKIPTTTSVLVKTRHVTGWAATYCGITKIVGIKYDVIGGGSGHNYSTNEQIVGTWIDGSPIYEKTIQATPTTGDYAIDISALNIDVVVDLWGISKQSISAGRYHSIKVPYCYDTNDRALVYYQSDTGYLKLVGSSANINNEWHIIIRYTKSSS